jgi:agmatine deiminase
MSRFPADLGYYFPAEWELHKATWLSWPHKEASWPGKLHSIYGVYSAFVKNLAAHEKVCINVNDASMKRSAEVSLKEAGADLSRVEFYLHPTNDAWCRDHGPAFLVNRNPSLPKVIVDWDYNAWGNKYPPFDLDDLIPTLIGRQKNLEVYHPGIIMEGGSVDFNGQGTVLTTASCLLNPNRNASLTQQEIEKYLERYYGISQVLWLGEGIAGDDTDGHIDDLARFISPDTVVTAIEKNRSDENYQPLQFNLEALKKMRLLNGKPLEIIEIPMPHAVVFDQIRLPASYLNFYIANGLIIFPTFRDPSNDQQAYDVLSGCFRDRNVIGLDATDIIWGLGSFHCLSQQEPA